MPRRRWFCQPCDHRHWWEHRHPRADIRLLGLVMMVVGVINIAIGLAELGLHI